MASIKIDGQSFEVENGQMLIEVADAAGIPIPRFCYHEKLSVAANCRMCLVEVEKAPKPLPACATPVMDGMVVHTRSDLAREAQQSVMEFLLINHPLDCPICDQGGECELQDLAMGYGKDSSRYVEMKRAVPSKDIGSLIATDMTRCIHCTRCVRFGVEIGGMKEMGAPGRGEHTKITTYLDGAINSELSGNMIDLCPVGALTSKPFRFSARAWELVQRDGIAPHDSLGSNIHYHVRNNKVMRVSPKQNNSLNEVWLSDRDRFSYQALSSQDRISQPMIKQDGEWQTTDWQTALQHVADHLQQIQSTQGGNALGALSSGTATVEEGYLLQKVMRGLGSHNIDHRLNQIDFSDQADAPLYPHFGQSPDQLEQVNAALIIGSNLRKEQPLLNHRLRKAMLKDRGLISEHVVGDLWVVNPIDYDFHMPLAGKLITTPDSWIADLAGIAKALHEAGTAINADIVALLTGVNVNETQQAIAKNLTDSDNSTVIVGQLAVAHPQFSTLRALAASIAQATNSSLSYVGSSGNSAGLSLAGMLPHRDVAGADSAATGLNAHAQFEQKLNAWLLLSVEPEQDAWHGSVALQALQQADFVVCLNSHVSEAMRDYAHVILPVSGFAETSGTHVNALGEWQSFTAAATAPGDTRPAWKVLRVLGNLLGLSEFDYADSLQICHEVNEKCEKMTQAIDNKIAWTVPSSLETHTKSDLQRIGELPLYAIDGMVRRATALQQTQDAQQSQLVHINAQIAEQLGLQDQQTAQVTQDGQTMPLTVQINAQVPDGCALIYAGQTAHAGLGGRYGNVSIKAN